MTSPEFLDLRFADSATLPVMHRDAAACHATLLAKTFGVAMTKADNPRFFEKKSFFCELRVGFPGEVGEPCIMNQRPTEELIAKTQKSKK